MRAARWDKRDRRDRLRGRPGCPVRRVCPANLITMAGRLRRSKGLFEAVNGVG